MELNRVDSYLLFTLQYSLGIYTEEIEMARLYYIALAFVVLLIIYSALSAQASAGFDIEAEAEVEVEFEAELEAEAEAEAEASSDQGQSLNYRSRNQAFEFNPVHLANLPTAACQGESDTFSLGGGTVAGSAVLGGGSSEVDPQCTLRRNLALVATLFPDFQRSAFMHSLVLGAVLQLEGFQPPEAEETEAGSREPTERTVHNRDK